MLSSILFTEIMKSTSWNCELVHVCKRRRRRRKKDKIRIQTKEAKKGGHSSVKNPFSCSYLALENLFIKNYYFINGKGVEMKYTYS